MLESSFIVFRLPPLHANLNKRLIKTPELFFYDTGLLCYLLGIRTPEQLELHPLRGPIFECWVVSEILKYHVHRGQMPQLFFHREFEWTSGGPRRRGAGETMMRQVGRVRRRFLSRPRVRACRPIGLPVRARTRRSCDRACPG